MGRPATERKDGGVGGMCRDLVTTKGLGAGETYSRLPLERFPETGMFPQNLSSAE